MTLDDLITAYRNDADSPFHKLRFATKENYRGLLRRLTSEFDPYPLEDLNARRLKHWHAQWSKPDHEDGKPKTTMSHGMIGMLRTLFNFGATLLDDKDCDRLATALHRMRFEIGKPRSQRLTYQQVMDVIGRANQLGLHSIATAQAFQWDGMLRQKDCIGEWVPEGERGKSDVLFEGRKWLFGIRYEEIDDDLVLRHITSKRLKPIELPLKCAPAVLAQLPPQSIMPSHGPVVVCETTDRPWTTIGFRRMWRRIADEVGIPKSVKNMDSRSGAISEAVEAGVDPNRIRQAATHSNISTTERYMRNDAEAAEGALLKRVEFRNGGAS